MKIGFAQFDVKYEDIETNIQTIDSMLRGVDADLIVLPELSLTGYYFEDRKTLIDLTKRHSDTEVIERLREIAAKNGFTMVIGLTEVIEEKVHNTAFLINHTGVVGKYRKMHLTDIESNFTPGESIEVFESEGIKIGIAICFDTWFPEMVRSLVDKKADVVCVPANFGGPWTLDVIKVRALENSIPVVLSNRVGSEVIQGREEFFRGESMIVDGYGNPLLKAYDQPYVGLVDIDLKAYSRDQSLICSSMEKERDKYKNNAYHPRIEKND